MYTFKIIIKAMLMSKLKNIIKKSLESSQPSTDGQHFSGKLNPTKIKKGLTTSSIGHEIVYFENIDSTNKEAKNLADKGAVEGTLVIAEEQTKGRGRLSRNWMSTPYESILMSLIFRPDLPLSKIFTLTMIASVAIVKAIKKTTGLKTRIKWPNDIYFNNKKLAGILTELNVKGNTINYAIVGIGLNVNFDPDKYPEIKEIATSLYKETGKSVSRNELLQTILIEIGREYSLLKNGKINKIRKQWNKNSLVIGKPVIVFSEGYSEEGIAESIAEDGSLILLKKDGDKKNILCGDVSLRLR
jgi:BirA family transcriptional regulator, biotin operon repressor / biotin---[acetyl-CoA-carboxylase] ligase